MCVCVCVCLYSLSFVCGLFCIATLQGVEGEMGETCYCLTSHTSLTHQRGHTCDYGHRTGRGKTRRSGEQRWTWRSIPACAYMNTKWGCSKCLVFGILLEIEDVGGGWCKEAGVHWIIIQHQNKSCLFPLYLSVLLWCNPFHLACCQGCSESNIRRLLYRVESCICSDPFTEAWKSPRDTASSTGRRN